MRNVRPALVVVGFLYWLVPAMPSAAAGPAAASEARALVAGMAIRQLDFLAAPEHRQRTRYVAVMRFGRTQLLLVSGRHPQPHLLDAQLARRQYEAVFRELQERSLEAGRLFVQDIAGLGLRASREPGEAFDIVYESAIHHTMFDGDWQTQRMTREAYMDTFARVSERYLHALHALLAVLEGTPRSLQCSTLPRAVAMLGEPHRPVAPQGSCAAGARANALPNARTLASK